MYSRVPALDKNRLQSARPAFDAYASESADVIMCHDGGSSRSKSEIRRQLGLSGVSLAAVDLLPLQWDLQLQRDFAFAASGAKRRKLQPIADLTKVAGRETLLFGSIKGEIPVRAQVSAHPGL